VIMTHKYNLKRSKMKIWLNITINGYVKNCEY
jgi:hypothetical protein